MKLLRNRFEAHVMIKDRRHGYNILRVHSSVAYEAPVDFKKPLIASEMDGGSLQHLMVVRKPAGRLSTSNSKGKLGYGSRLLIR
jgi:hypothetical protein